jgi:hypothetical protein
LQQDGRKIERRKIDVVGEGEGRDSAAVAAE